MNSDISLPQLDSSEIALQESKFDMASQWPQMLDSEKIGAKSLYAMMYEVHPSGKIRFTRGLYLNLFPDAYKDPNQIYRWTKFQKKIIPLSMWFFMPDRPDSIFQMIDAAYQPYYAVNWSEYLNTKPAQPFNPLAELRKCPSYPSQWNVRGDIDLLSAMVQTTVDNFRHILLRCESGRRSCLLLCAMQRYRIRHQAWPERLEDLLPAVSEELLTDPVSLERFVYKRDVDSFILYSKGFDGIDDGGKSKTIFDPNKPSITHLQDDILFWPAKLPETF